jgi:hypothetical protein
MPLAVPPRSASGIRAGDKERGKRIGREPCDAPAARFPHGRFEVAVVVSNGSDLLEPIKIVREQLGKQVGILNPQKHPSRALLPHIDFIKQIRGGVLRAAQLPVTLIDATGAFTEPAAW